MTQEEIDIEAEKIREYVRRKVALLEQFKAELERKMAREVEVTVPSNVVEQIYEESTEG
jgi:hypothetical protein